MPEKTKVPFYNRWWFWVIAVFLVIGIVNADGDDEESVSSEHNNVTNEDNRSVENVNKQTDEDTSVEANKVTNKENNEKPAEGAYGDGTYKVGTDIPPGEYLVFSDDEFGTYVENAKDSTGQFESIIYNLNLYNGAHAYVTVYEGEYLKLEGGFMYPIENAPSVIPEDGVYKDGMYKVGQDLPAGEYKVLLSEDAMFDSGYLEVTTDSRHDFSNIVTNDFVKTSTYITVSEGQYLKLEGLFIDTN